MGKLSKRELIRLRAAIADMPLYVEQKLERNGKYANMLVV
jgi:hypothetical protein